MSHYELSEKKVLQQESPNCYFSISSYIIFQEYHFRRVLWMGSYDEAVEGFSNADQLFGQEDD